MTEQQPEQHGDQPRAAHFVQSLARGLAVIRAFDADHAELTLSEVAKECGLPRAAARRFLLTLADLGYVRTDGSRFRLTPRVLELGFAFLSSVPLPEIAEPHLERLVAEVHESASMSVLDGGHIVYVARVPTRRIMTVNITVGTRFPAHVTAMGRVLLAHLPAAERERRLTALLAEPRDRHGEPPPTPHTISDPDELRAELERVRAQGYAVVDQELEEGLRSIAAPVRDSAGAVAAAVNVPVHASRTGAEELRETILPHLLDCVARIQSDLHATRR
ncbi:IclR family transcriptional regulator domain-containing protein [Phaeacidiphilus oryzae]|uniref:IclR family transcriptional regulator domain-containing protein n=1 Tax=Phaeacidiphilus oryzae TaxID=348818 RepID=UPI00068EF842|nr:IclR family transcriptional regulator C-terminal domain-containing protein [Phaeacidiphilus oryzae]